MDAERPHKSAIRKMANNSYKINFGNITKTSSRSKNNDNNDDDDDENDMVVEKSDVLPSFLFVFLFVSIHYWTASCSALRPANLATNLCSAIETNFSPSLWKLNHDTSKMHTQSTHYSRRVGASLKPYAPKLLRANWYKLLLTEERRKKRKKKEKKSILHSWWVRGEQ